jgi:hypothetical protein
LLLIVLTKGRVFKKPDYEIKKIINKRGERVHETAGQEWNRYKRETALNERSFWSGWLDER